MNNLVSVIMSTYNEKIEWVKESIESILNQSYKNLEFIIILDNPKNFHLKELLYEYRKKDTRIKIIVNKENLGLVKSLNIALNYCSGEYIARMDADDISVRDRLLIQKNYLEKYKLDLLFSSTINIDESGLEIGRTNPDELSVEEVKKSLEEGNISTHPTWFVKKEVYKKLSGYRDVPYCEDYDFILRCLFFGFRIGMINQNLLMYRVRSNSITKTYTIQSFLNSRGSLMLYLSKKLDNHNLLIQMKVLSESFTTEKAKTQFTNVGKEFRLGIKLIKKLKILRGLSSIIKSIIYFMKRKYIVKRFDNSMKRLINMP